MSALVSAIAFPVCAAVIWIALRTPLASRLTAKPSRERWHKQRNPCSRGNRRLRGDSRGRRARHRGRRGRAEATRCSRSSARAALLFAVGLLDDAFGLPALAKLAAQGGAAAIVLTNGLTVELVKNDWIAVPLAVVWLVGMTNAFNLLDHMDGIAATVAGIACAYFAIDAVTVHSNDLVLVLSLSRCLRVRRLSPLQRPAQASPRPSSSATRAARSSASRWPRSRSRPAGRRPRRRSRRCFCRCSSSPSRSLTPRSSRSCALLERRPIHVGGRDHTSHRLVYTGLSEKRTLAAPRRRGGRARGHEPRLQRREQLGSHADRRPHLLRRPHPGRRLPGRLRPPACSASGLAEMLLDFALIAAAFACAYLPALRGRRAAEPAAPVPGRAAAHPGRTLRRVHPDGDVLERLALHERAGRDQDPDRRLPLGGHRRRSSWLLLAGAELRDLLAQRLRDRRDHLHAPDRPVTAGRARDSPGPRHAGPAGRSAARPDRRRRTRRTEPPAGVAGDAGTAGDRLHRRRSGACATGACTASRSWGSAAEIDAVLARRGSRTSCS